MRAIPNRRKFLFIALLGSIGIAAAALAGAVLIWCGVIRYAWTDALLYRLSLRRAGGVDERLLVLGDSFLSWWPVQHCLRTDLEAWCRAEAVTLLNAAYGGFGPYEYRDQMRQQAPLFKPTRVILFYYVGNDLTDVQYRPNKTPNRPADFVPAMVVITPPEQQAARERRRHPAGDPSAPPGATQPAPPLPPVFTPVAVAADPPGFDWAGMGRHGIDPELIQFAKNRAANPNLIGREYVNPYLLVTSMIMPRILPDNLLIETESGRVAWAKVEGILGEIATQARAMDAEFTLVAIPNTTQVDRSHFDFYARARLPVEDRFLDSDRPQALLGEFCARRKIEFIDLLPVFRESADRAGLYWENDDHLSEAGHRLAFDMVRRRCLEPIFRD